MSIVIPAKNESASLPGLVEEITSAFRPLVQREANEDEHRLDWFEILIVDDGSTDETVAVLGDLMMRYPELRPLRNANGGGQTTALVSGFWAARGQWIGILDADLQNPPAELARVWDATAGHDAGLGWRIRREDTRFKKIISKWANRTRNAVLGQSIRDTGCAVRIMRREALLRMPMFDGVHRFFGPLLLRQGCRIVQVPVEHRPRPHGKSHYNIWNRSWKVIIDLLGVAWLMRRPLGVDAALFDPTMGPDAASQAEPAPHAVENVPAAPAA